MSPKPRIFSTRKLTSPRIAELVAQGWEFRSTDFISKVIRIPDNFSPETIHKHVVLTSITAVKAFVQIAKQFNLNTDDYSIFCISRGTLEYAYGSGLDVKASAPNASLLADEIIRHSDVKEVTHVSSNLRRDELSEKLTTAGILVHEVTAYQTEFTPEALDFDCDGLVFFSPSAVDSFLSKNPVKNIPCFCIGQTTADHALLKGFSKTYVPTGPSEDLLINTIINYYSKNTAHA